jgi:hypothetical protein
LGRDDARLGDDLHHPGYILFGYGKLNGLRGELRVPITLEHLEEAKKSLPARRTGRGLPLL